MKTIYPKYFNKFNCIADKCPDTCCAGWEVVIDKKFEQLYKSSNTPAAKKAVSRMYTDSDGDVCLRLANGRCPMLNDNNLCEIYIDMGKDALCDVCKNYPRFFKESKNCIIAGLSVSCPEVASIILSDNSDKIIQDLSFADKNEIIFFEIYNLVTSIIYESNFLNCDFEKLEFASDEFIFNREMFCTDVVRKSFEKHLCDYSADFAKKAICTLSNLEFLTGEWQEVWNRFKIHISKCGTSQGHLIETGSFFADLQKSGGIKNFAVYFLYKYLWEAIEDQSIDLWIKRAYVATRLVCELCCSEFFSHENATNETIARLCRLLCKEFEHNEDNLAVFEDFCCEI